MDAGDPRLEWLLSQAPRWRDAKEKTLVFVAHRETLEMLRDGAQPPGAARHRRLPRGAVAGAARHGSRAVPRARWSKPARVDRMRRRGPQLRVLPPPGAVRPAVETVGRGAAHRPARSHRPAHPGGDRLLPSAGGHRRATSCGCSRRWVSSASRWPALEPQLAHVEGALEDDRARSGGVAVRRHASTRSSARRTRRARASAKRRTSSFIAIPTGRTWRPAFSRACRRELDALNEEVVVTACIAPGLHASSTRAAAGSSRSSSATGRWSTACRASPAARATSARSIARRRSRTRPSTSSPRGIRSSRASLPTSRTAPSAASLGSRVEIGAGTRRGARGHLQGRAGVRGRGVRLRWSGSAGLGSGVPSATPPRAPVTDGAEREPSTGQAWSVVWVHGSTQRVVRTRSRPSWCDPCQRAREPPVGSKTKALAEAQLEHFGEIVYCFS